MNDHRKGAHAAENGHKRSTDSAINELLALEQLRVAVTRINRLGLERPARIVAVTSAIASEGKTTIATNVAMVMARFFDRKTLLIDCDFRRPGVAKLLGGGFTHGFAEVLRGDVEPTAARWQVLERLTVLPLIKPEPAAVSLLSQLAARERFKAATAGFDTVIIDTPPVLPLADNSILSDIVDGFIFIVKAEQTPRRLIASALKNIPREKLIGFILNNAQLFGRSEYYGPGYH